jgi:hypothetical protein
VHSLLSVRGVAGDTPGKRPGVSQPQREDDKVGAGTLPLFLVWVLLLTALIALYLVIGLLDK